MSTDRRPVLYYTPASAPCRAVIMTAEALRLSLNMKVLDLMQKEHLQPGFLKINPHHAVPTLTDNEFSLGESRAICIYLVEKYGRNDSLYPKNPKMRAAVNRLLYFDMGTLYKSVLDYFTPIFEGGEPDEKKYETVKEAVAFLDNFLEDKQFAVAYRLTIADLVLFATVSSMELIDFDFSPYPNVTAWLENMRENAPGRDINQEGIDMLKAIIQK